MKKIKTKTAIGKITLKFMMRDGGKARKSVMNFPPKSKTNGGYKLSENIYVG